ncbi:MAG TPA: CocE/NonD family hydrolase, partial [Candidatus Thermoplasmatota archaeon]
MIPVRRITVLAVVAPLAGCFGPSTGAPPSESTTAAENLWPHPDGDDWPAGLVGPFALRSITNHTISRNEGVTLFGSVLMPDVPEGVRVPTVLEVGPYFDNEDNPTWATTKVSVQEPSRPLEWVQEGYAVAYWSVRGTGRSTGCFEMGGANEADDSAAIVEWL